ncbi:hypothetical protein KY349_04705 [Candidatus Woesearchaeota archaeon]|jgi:uncharacterized protein YecT (DUF1311 family)|nr:hypothetical protein [Candidatus Woesearchaeota archaeon]
MKLKNLFNKDKRLKAAFRAVKTDKDILEEQLNALKDSTNEWIMFLDQENRHLKMRLKDTEKKLNSADNLFEEEQLSVLRTI